MNQKKAGIAIIVADKVNSKTEKKIICDKVWHYLMIKGTIFLKKKQFLMSMHLKTECQNMWGSK